MSDNNEKLSPRYWAEKLAEILTPEEFSNFALFLDGCDDVDFSHEVAKIDAARNPHLYIGDHSIRTKDYLGHPVQNNSEECEECNFDHASNPNESDAVHQKLAEQDVDRPEK